MTVDWGEYSPFRPGVSRPLNEVSRPEAKAAFECLMDAKPKRLRILGELALLNGFQLSSDQQGLRRLNDWFRTEVSGSHDTGRLEPTWYVVVNDVSLFLGDTIIGRAPGVWWTMFTKENETPPTSGTS